VDDLGVSEPLRVDEGASSFGVGEAEGVEAVVGREGAVEVAVVDVGIEVKRERERERENKKRKKEKG
jgi:hypothetical protein